MQEGCLLSEVDRHRGATRAQAGWVGLLRSPQGQASRGEEGTHQSESSPGGWVSGLTTQLASLFLNTRVVLLSSHFRHRSETYCVHTPTLYKEAGIVKVWKTLVWGGGGYTALGLCLHTENVTKQDLGVKADVSSPLVNWLPSQRYGEKEAR